MGINKKFSTIRGWEHETRANTISEMSIWRQNIFVLFLSFNWNLMIRHLFICKASNREVRPGKPIKTVMIYSSHSLRCPGGLSSRRLYRFGIIWNLTNREIFKHNSTSFYLLQLFLGSVLSEFCFMFLAFMAQAHFLYVRWQNGHKRTLFFCLNLGQTTMVRV